MFILVGSFSMGGLRARLDVEGVVVPFLLALQSVLGSFQLLDALGPVYYPMVHRATREVRFELGVSLVAPLLVLLTLWLGWAAWERRLRALFIVSLGLLVYPFLGIEGSVSAVSLLAAASGLWFHRRLEEFFTGVFALLGGFEALALFHWVFFVPLGLSSPLEGVAWVEMGLFYLAAYLAPLLVLPLMFMWILKPIAEWGWGKIEGVKIEVLRERRGVSSRGLLFLALSLSLAVVAALYPYGKIVNPEGRGVGVDIPHYVEAALIVEGDPSQAFSFWGGSRPLIFFVIYGFQRVIGSDVSFAVRFLPLVLNPLLVVSVFFLALEVFGDEGVAGWAAFFTVCGFQVVVGMYSYFLTNMLGLSLIFFSLGFLFRALRRGCRLSLVFACLFGGLLVFTHSWTFYQYVASAVLTAGVMLYDVRGGGGDYGKVKFILGYLVSLSLVEVLKILVFRGFGGVSASLTILARISDLSEFWLDSIFSFRLLYGGMISVVVLVGLAVVGVYLIERWGIPGIYFTVFLAVTSLLFLIGDETIKSRLIYNVPIGLFAALGFKSVISRKVSEDFKRVLISFVVLYLTLYMLRSLANLIS